MLTAASKHPQRMNNMITPVVLCGGSGTRLWPLSRQSFPKQFVPLVGNKSLLQLTLDRLAWCDNPVICVAAEDHRFLVADAIEAENVPGQVLLEPAARNTAAAMALAALLARAANNADPLLLFCPSDHHIPDAAAFAKTIREGVPAAEAGAIVTFGVVPSFPSSAYGYIQQGDERTDGSRQVARFIEKPAPAAAQALLLQGHVLWNAGIFLTRASTLLAALAQHAADILQSCENAMAAPREDTVGQIHFVRPKADPFLSCRSQSIDYAVMEPHDNVAVVPFQGQWSDVGSWNAVAELTDADEADSAALLKMASRWTSALSRAPATPCPS